jgi:hypothetical protein
MATSIHAHLEYKVEGKWYHWSSLPISRYYDLFAKMAGVRDKYVTPISPPKGIPDDATDSTIFDYDYWRTNSHDESWLADYEILRLDEWLQCEGTNLEDVLGTFLFGRNITSHMEYPEENSLNIESVRIVFWFDC